MRLVARFCILVFVLFLHSLIFAQPDSDQDWTTSHGIVSDTITVNCSQFLLPVDLGRVLSEPSAPTTDSGEMSQSMKAGHPIKITLQPESGVSDTLSTISGCAVSGAEIYLSTHDVGDTITINDSGNIDPPGSSVTLDNPEDIVVLSYRGAVWRFVGGLGGGGGGGCADLDSCFDAENEIDNAGSASPLRISLGGDDALEFFIDAANNDAPTIRSICDGGSCPPTINIPSGETRTIQGNAIALETLTSAGVHAYLNGATPAAPVCLPALGLETPAFQTSVGCDYGAQVQINGGPYITPVKCQKNVNARFDGAFPMKRTGWNGGQVRFAIHVNHPTTELITHAGDFFCQCRGDLGTGDVVDNNWSGAAAADISLSTANATEIQETAAVTCDGSCQPGDTVYFYWQIDDPNYDANAANTNVTHVCMHYEKKTRDGDAE